MAKPEDAARWIALESDDYDALGGSEGYGWARATTDDVAAGIGVSTEEAYRLLKAAARKDLVTQDKERRKGVHTKRFGASQVGWAIWEVHLTREQALKRHNEEDCMNPMPRRREGGAQVTISSAFSHRVWASSVIAAWRAATKRCPVLTYF